MEQVTLDLDNDAHEPASPKIDPEREQQLVALMAEAIVVILLSQPGEDHEPG